MKKLISLLLALVMAFSIVGCAKTEAPAETAAPTEKEIISIDTEQTVETGVVRGGTLVIAKTQDMTNNGFDITHTTYSQADSYVLDQILETLIDIDGKGNFIPRLALSWKFTDDGLGLQLKLREDVTYSNGTKFNAEAAAKVMNYYLTDECKHVSKKADLALITSIDVIDEYTIQVNTSDTDAGLLTELSGTSFMLCAPENIDNGDFATNPIGTGPFVLAEYAEGDHITLKARSDYYIMGEDGKPLPYLDGILYKILPDDAAKVANLQSGDVDGIDLQSSANSTLTCMGMDNMVTYQPNYNINFWAGFNFADEALAKLEVRQANSYAIDRHEIVDVVFEGLATTTPFFSRADQGWYDEYAGINEYNPDKAKELLAAAGYADGIEITVSCISREPDNTIMQLMQSQMAKAGITLVLEPMERTAWVAKAKTDLDYQMIVGQNGNAGVDLSRQMKDPFVSYQTLEIPEAVASQELYNKLKTITDVDERNAAVAELQKHFHDNVIKLMICQSYSYSTFADYVKGIRLTSFGSYNFAETWIEK